MGIIQHYDISAEHEELLHQAFLTSQDDLVILRPTSLLKRNPPGKITPISRGAKPTSRRPSIDSRPRTLEIKHLQILPIIILVFLLALGVVLPRRHDMQERVGHLLADVGNHKSEIALKCLTLLACIIAGLAFLRLMIFGLAMCAEAFTTNLG